MSESTRVQTYRGATQQAAWEAFQRDAAEAARHDWVPVGHQWGPDFLQVSYQQKPQPPAVHPAQPAPSAQAGPEQPYANTTCPSCGVALDPLPKAKKTCPECAEDIYVRTGPDGLLYLLSEGGLEAWEDNLEVAKLARETLREYAKQAREGWLDGVMVSVGADACPACQAMRVGRSRSRMPRPSRSLDAPARGADATMRPWPWGTGKGTATSRLLGTARPRAIEALTATPPSRPPPLEPRGSDVASYAVSGRL